jgi:uncharacterized protein YbaR (Trm112 family)
VTGPQNKIFIKNQLTLLRMRQIPVAIWCPPIGEEKHHLVCRHWHQGYEIPEHIWILLNKVFLILLVSYLIYTALWWGTYFELLLKELQKYV